MKRLKLAIDEAYDKMQIADTKFIFHKTMELQLKLASFTPVSGSSYIPTPNFILHKKATINIKNPKDNKCFLWSVLAHIHPVEKNSERLTNYKKYEAELDLTGLKFPVELKDIEKFENIIHMQFMC